MTDLNKQRLTLLTGQQLTFSNPRSIPQQDALEFFQGLSEDRRTEMLGEMYGHYAMWYNDQQVALEAIRG